MPENRSVARLRQWWPLAAFLLVGAVAGAAMNVTWVVDRVLGAAGTVHRYKVCNLPEECIRDNLALLETLENGVGKDRSFSLELTRIPSGEYFSRCANEDDDFDFIYSPQSDVAGSQTWFQPTDPAVCMRGYFLTVDNQGVLPVQGRATGMSDEIDRVVGRFAVSVRGYRGNPLYGLTFLGRD